MRVYAVVLSTAGNQNYIFGSNKRRENVGASHLITCVEGEWLAKALAEIGVDGRRQRVEEHGIEVVTANAGGVTMLVRDRKIGRRIVGSITESALREAPGLDVCGAVGEAIEWGNAKEVADGIADTRELLTVARARRRGPRLRFPGVPIAARCTSSGLPAHGVVKLHEERSPEARSAPSLAKLNAFDSALLRLAVKMGLCAENDESQEAAARRTLRQIVDHLNHKAEWVAVVHVDGNGLGKVFQHFASIMGGPGDIPADEYTEGLRSLSDGVDECAREAFRSVFAKLRRGRWTADTAEPPVLPLILGGDDLTVVCDGELALPFARDYLEEFTRLANEHGAVGGVLKQVEELRGLGACAGVAIVKRQYPFHSAVHLAEQLTSEAKAVKRELGQDKSALSFHVLYESAFADLRRLRDQQTLSEEDTCLTGQPYVVGEASDAEWARHRRWADLERQVAALTAKNDGTLVISGGQAHELRSALFRGREAAESRFATVSTWLGVEAVQGLASDGSLFWHDGHVHRTGLLDALNAAPFLSSKADS
ncbi:Cas10/Cmr2 second palm domain-containing protein [Actinomadura decatromicini]|uniref:Cas10/Cmr2 second palm domain-containing protein n=1 Tax=Actinomadura decatromicini TaxID=2604572 RepID=A0A5D3FX71_9ACTN|nr:hypothetical protein [Actinomadura decatromicini]TYK52612.1 hypothetical protein FXF68_02240 [Actinomadura decatromicini]